MGKWNMSAGHGKRDSKSCGAIDLMCESTENRPIKDKLISIMREQKETVRDNTVDYPSSKSDCINKVVEDCNKNRANFNIQIHLNSGRKDRHGDSKIGGCEVLVYNTTGTSYTVGKRVCEQLAKLGFTNRGVKVNKELGFIANTYDQAMIIEICFVDDMDDVKLYNQVKDKIPYAIASALLNKAINPPSNTTPKPTNPTTDSNTYYRVCTGSFKYEDNADKQIKELKSKGYDPFIFIHKQ